MSTTSLQAVRAVARPRPRRPSWRPLAAALVAFGGAAAWGAEGTWTEVATHAAAAAQPTAAGRTLGALQGWDGKLYSGYGDYGANTGPIQLMAFDPSAGAFTNEYPDFQTEAVYVFRPLFGRLYVPPIDPRAVSGLAVAKAGKGWEFQEVFMAHGFDVATLTGGDLWLVGSSDLPPAYGSTALRSLDDGATWQLSLNDRTANDDWSRYYFVCALEGKLYVQSSETNSCRVFDGSAWSDGPGIARYGSLAQAFAGRMVLLSHRFTANDSGELLSFDGAATNALLAGIHTYTVSGDTLFALGADRTIRSTTNLCDWATVSTNAPEGSRSVAVLGRLLYVGTTNSSLHVFSLPVDARPAVRVLPTPEPARERGPVAGAFTVKRAVPTDTALTVAYAVSGSASPGDDYEPLPGSVTIPAGADSAAVPVVPVADRIAEGAEFVTLALVPDAAYAIETPADARIVIDDDRLPTVANGAATNIHATAADLTGSLVSTGAWPTAVSVFWATNDCAADAAAWLACGAGTNLGLRAAGETFTASAAGLRTNTLYFFNCMASNAAGVAWGAASGSPGFRTLGRDIGSGTVIYLTLVPRAKNRAAE